MAPRAEADKAAGLSLYDDADRLGAAGKWTEACGKFEASEKEYPRPVTLLCLGDCYEHVGKTASAWATFRETALSARSAQSNPEFDADKEKRREVEATSRRDAIEKKLTRIKLVISKPLPGLVVKRGGKEISSEAWGSAVAVDPGAIAFEASAPGYVTWTDTREVKGEGQTIEVVVPELKAEARPAPERSVTRPVVIRRRVPAFTCSERPCGRTRRCRPRRAAPRPHRARDGRRGGGVKMPKLTLGVCARPCRRTSSGEWTMASVEVSSAPSCMIVAPRSLTHSPRAVGIA